MKKYFFVSDIHSCYDALLEALEENGFDINNQEHVLCVLGDVFDRGHDTIEVYEFLKSIPDDRLILIKGNHEILYEEVLELRFPDKADFTNGTVRTFCTISGIDEQYLDPNYWYIHNLFSEEHVNISKQVVHYWDKVKEIVESSEITQWIKSKKWVNYFETSNYIFVHSWIPVQEELKFNRVIVEIGPREDWRNATQFEWNDATWGCPYKKAKLGWNVTNKTIVCGHWRTSAFFKFFRHEKRDEYDCPIFKSKKYKLIGLDACTIKSDKVNVLVLNEDEL